MLAEFRTYQLALSFYKEIKELVLPGHIKEQLVRAASSICLNLAEGHGRMRGKDQMRFYKIAFGSIRECQAIVDLEKGDFSDTLYRHLDHLAASAYRLMNRAS